MRIEETGSELYLYLSARETSAWSALWPCSVLSGHRLMAAFSNINGDLIDYTIDGRTPSEPVPSDEFNAITSDALSARRPGHPAIHAEPDPVGSALFAPSRKRDIVPYQPRSTPPPKESHP